MAKKDENQMQESTQILGMSDGDPFSTVQIQEAAKVDEEIIADNEEETEEIDETQEVEETEEESEGEGETEEEEVVEESEESEEEESDQTSENPYYNFAQALKSDGFLSEDVEIGEDISGSAIKNLYKNSIQDSAYSEIRSEVLNDLKSEGLDETTVLYAQAIKAGVDVSQLNAAARLERMSNIDIETAKSADKVSLIKSWYKDRGLSEKESARMLEDVEIDEGDDGVDNLAKEAKKFYKNGFKEYKTNQSKALEDNRTAQKRARIESEKRVNAILTKRNIMGESITKEQADDIKKAIYEATEQVELNGQIHNATEFQKFRHEFNTSEEIQLLMFKKFKYLQTDKESIKKEVKEEVEDDFLKGYKKSVKKDITPKKKRKTKKKNNDTGLIETTTTVGFR